MQSPLLPWIFLVLILPFGTQAAERTRISWERKQLTDQFYAEGATLADLNRDGHGDVVAGPFLWLGPSFERKIEIYPAKPFNINGYSDNFFAYTRDFDADGWLDLLVIGFPGKEARWYRNPGAETGNWEMSLALAQVDNESAGYGDLTGDGEPEIYCSVNGVFGYAQPKKDAPKEPWTWHRLSPDNATGAKFTHGLGIGDVNGDGRIDLLEKSRWWEQPASLADDPEWTSHRADFSGPGGAQMHAYDFDGDGDQDVLTSLSAHQFGLAWFEQKDGKFLRHSIITADPLENPYGVAFSQLHAVALEDIDGDGLKDIVTGKRFWAHNGHDPGERDPAVIYWFRTVRAADGTVEFIPHLIDDNSGVGVEVKTGDSNGDSLPDVVVANKHGVFLHLQRRETVDEAAWQALQPRKAFLDGILPMEQYATGRPAKEAAAAMTIPPGFQVSLIASEPDITQPVTFCFDDRGRIWIAEALNYPNPAAPGGGKDRIHILEDADHDGSFETHKIFAEKLNLVSGLEVGFGGVWVGAAPYLLFIPDRNGDDVPDGEPEILLDGWGTQDTHETLNSFKWGPDGWLYGCHGVFTKSNIGKPGTPDAERIFLDAGVWRYHPVRHRFEVFARGTSNPWGLDFDATGEWFATACVIPHLWHIVPGNYYQRQAGQHANPYLGELTGTIAKHLHYAGNIAENAHWGPRKDAHADVLGGNTFLAGGGHAHCGLAIYQGDSFPPEFRGALLMHNLHGHRMNWDHVEPAGASYVGDRRPDFLFANDHWYVGTHIDYGPDGALYFADWQDDTTCHRRDDAEWDRSNGRLFRIQYGAPNPVTVNLRAQSDAELARLQTHSNQWFVRTSRRLLQERAASRPLDAQAVTSLRAHLDPKHPIPLRLDALGTLFACGLATPDLLEPLLADPAPLVSARAVRLLAEQGTFPEAPLADPVVRREIASSLRQAPAASGREIAARLIAKLTADEDPLVARLTWYGTEPLVAADPAWALSVAQTTKHDGIRTAIYRRIAAIPESRTALFEQTNADPTIIVAALAEQMRTEAATDAPPSWAAFSDRVRPLAAKNPELRRQFLFLAGKFRDERVRPELRSLLADSAQSIELRTVALEALAQDPESLPVLRGLITGGASPLRQTAIVTAGNVGDDASVAAILSVLPGLEQSEQSAALSVLCGRLGSAKSLLEEVGAGRVSRNLISVVAARQMQQLGDEALNGMLSEHWGALQTSGGDAGLKIAKWKAVLTPDRLAKASAAKGRLLFNQTCYACHVLYGQGNLIGPDLTGANRRDLDYLLENILNPNAVIGKDYQLHVLYLRDGEVVAGMARGESASALTLILPGGVERSVSKDAITRRELLAQSLMPEGLLDALPEADAVDLIAYLRSETQVPVARPGETVFEGEDLTVTEATGGKTSKQPMGGFKADTWSGKSQLWWTGNQPGNRLSLGFQVSEAGSYALSLILTKAPDYAQVRILLDNNIELIRSIDLYDPAVRTTGVIELGTHSLSPGTHQLRFDILDKNAKALPRYMVGIDSLMLLKK